MRDNVEKAPPIIPKTYPKIFGINFILNIINSKFCGKMKFVQWPLKILLVHPQAPFLAENRIVIVADCVVLMRPEIAKLYDEGVPILIGCPLLEDPDAMINKLKLILGTDNVKDVDVITMEVPCCQALHMMVKQIASENNLKHRFTHKIVRIFTKEVEEWRHGQVDESMIELERIAHKGLNDEEV
jgi:hypothetical protein